MRTLPHTEFAALLARADVSQAAFARLAGLTPRQVNNWARGRAAVPIWAGLLAVVLQDHSPEALTIMLEETAASHLDDRGKHRHPGLFSTSALPLSPQRDRTVCGCVAARTGVVLLC
jgi:transcriptional regulator with XRE-family HTH domain